MKKLTEEQIRLGGDFLGCSNLGGRYGKLEDRKQLEDFIRTTVRMHECDGIDPRPELIYWRKLLKKGDKFSLETVKEKLPFLFE